MNPGCSINEKGETVLTISSILALSNSVEPNDQKPHIICETCYISIVNINEIKERADKSKVISNYQTSKRKLSISIVFYFYRIRSSSTKDNWYAFIQNKRLQITKLKGSDYHPLGGSDAIGSNEPRFCLCDQIEFGEMIACDYEKVEPNDQKPHIICETCYISIVNINEIKERADKSKVISNYQTSKRKLSISIVFYFYRIRSSSTKDNLYAFIQNKRLQITKLKGSDYHPLGGSDAIGSNEPRFCLCDQIEFGEMIACDYEKVEPNDQKPHIICETCYISIVNINEIKERADKSKVISGSDAIGSNEPRFCLCDQIEFGEMIACDYEKNKVIKYQGQFVCFYSEVLKVLLIIQIQQEKMKGGSDAIDSNEPRFCLCDQIEFGEMIACDYEKDKVLLKDKRKIHRKSKKSGCQKYNSGTIYLQKN
ncbi:hypothetical protein QTP88_011620 [Uroleucon formosanum]